MKIIETEKAPKAIGTYSQATKVNGFLFISGQIPLDPKTMELAEGIESNSFAIETSRNLGLPNEIISEAEKNLDSDYLQYKSLIEELNNEQSNESNYKFVMMVLILFEESI